MNVFFEVIGNLISAFKLIWLLFWGEKYIKTKITNFKKCYVTLSKSLLAYRKPPMTLRKPPVFLEIVLKAAYDKYI